MTSACQGLLTIRWLFRTNRIVIFRWRMMDFRLINVSWRSHVLNQVSFRRVHQFAWDGLRTFSLTSNMMNGPLILSRFRTFTIRGPSQASSLVGIKTVLFRRFPMVFFSRASFRTFSSTYFNLGAFKNRMVTRINFNRSSWKGRRTLRGLLQGFPWRMKLILRQIISNRSMAVAIRIFRLTMVSHDGPNAIALIYPFARGPFLGWEVTRSAKIKDTSARMLIGRVLRSSLSRLYTSVNRVILSTWAYNRFLDFCSFVKLIVPKDRVENRIPNARHSACRLVPLFLGRSTNDQAICPTARTGRCPFFSFFRMGGFYIEEVVPTSNKR